MESFSLMSQPVTDGYAATVVFQGTELWRGTKVHPNMGSATAEAREKVLEVMQRLFQD